MPSNNGPADPADTAPASNSLLLSKGVTRLEVTLKLTTAILALAAGVWHNWRISTEHKRSLIAYDH